MSPMGYLWSAGGGVGPALTAVEQRYEASLRWSSPWVLRPSRYADRGAAEAVGDFLHWVDVGLLQVAATYLGEELPLDLAAVGEVLRSLLGDDWTVSPRPRMAGPELEIVQYESPAAAQRVRFTCRHDSSGRWLITYISCT